MKKKILFITPSLCQGGIEHSLITALELLDKSKYQITLLVMQQVLDLLPLVPEEVEVLIDKESPHYFRKPRAVWLKGVSEIGGRIGKRSIKEKYSEQLRQYIHKQKAIHPAKDIIRKRDFDVVISYAVGMCTETALNVNAKKRIVFFHSSLDVHHNLMTKLFPEFDTIVAVNDGVKEMLCNNYTGISNKIFVIYNYVDAIKIIDKAKESINYGIHNSDYILATCGRISKEKGFDLAVEAADYLKKHSVKFNWLFIGDGADRAKIEQSIKEKDLSGYIEITGYKDNPYPYMDAADIYVQPSYEEAQPLVLLETMVLGKPIVSTKTVGGTTILKGGEKGILTGFSGQDIAKGILSLINNPDKCHSFKNQYTLEENKKEKQIYIDKLNQLLSFG